MDTIVDKLEAMSAFVKVVALGNYADPANVNYTMSILIVVILVNYVGMTYGPIGAFLAASKSARNRQFSSGNSTTTCSGLPTSGEFRGGAPSTQAEP